MGIPSILFALGMVDSVPIGAWNGSGRKSNWLSPILMGCWNPQTGTYQGVMRCMSGISDTEYKALTLRLRGFLGNDIMANGEDAAFDDEDQDGQDADDDDVADDNANDDDVICLVDDEDEDEDDCAAVVMDSAVTTATVREGEDGSRASIASSSSPSSSSSSSSASSECLLVAPPAQYSGRN